MKECEGFFKHRLHLLLSEWFCAPWQENFQKAAHMRSLEFLWQGNSKLNTCEHLLFAALLRLDKKRQFDPLDPNTLNGNTAAVCAALYILHHTSSP